MIKKFDEFINESTFGNRYGNNNLNKHLHFALLKVRDFCDEQNLVYHNKSKDYIFRRASF